MGPGPPGLPVAPMRPRGPTGPLDPVAPLVPTMKHSTTIQIPRPWFDILYNIVLFH